MNTLLMKFEQNGESFPIWNTDQTDLQSAWDEMDEHPTEGGWIMFDGEDNFLVVNGGFSIKMEVL